MRKLILYVMTTLDGYFEGPDGDISWHKVDAEYQEFTLRMVSGCDTFLFGRRTYELMQSYWTTEQARTSSPEVAAIMNGYPKLVLSRSLQSADWENTSLLENEAQLASLKQQAGKDILIMGSSNLGVSLLKARLLDEIRVVVTPVLLGKGKPLLNGMESPQALRLLETKIFSSGNVLHTYQPL